MISVVILSKNPPKKVIDYLYRQTIKDIEIIYATEKGIVKAMNNALNIARGSIFVRIDDDVALPPWWLENLIEPFSDPIIAGVTGPTFVPYNLRKNRDSIRIAEKPNVFLRWLFDNDPFARAKIYTCGSVSYGSNYAEKCDNEEWFEPDHLEGTNWAMRTDLIRAVGGFDESFTGVCEWYDTDVEYKIKKLGYKLCYNPSAAVCHLLEKGDHYSDRFEGWGRIKNLLRFHWRHGRWRFYKLKFYVNLLLWVGYFVGKGFKK